MRGEGDGGCGLPRARSALAMTGVFVRGAGAAGRCGERTERCQWQRKRSERVAAVKILSDSRKAAQKFWAPQQDHRPLRNGLQGRMTLSARDGTQYFCRAGPVCPAGSAVQGRAAGEGTPPYGGTRSTAKRDVEDAPSCCSFMLCVGGGVLDAPSCCSFMMRVGGDAHIAPPLRRGCKG